MHRFSDTSTRVEQVVINLLQNAPLAKRIAIMRSLSNRVAALSYRAIRRAKPAMTENEKRAFYVECHYGADLALKFGRYLKQNHA